MALDYVMIANIGTLQRSHLAHAYTRHLMLAQFAAPSCPYHQCYSDLIREFVRMGHHVILDNGAFEGQLVPDEQYLNIIKLTKPTAVVLPDIVGASNIDSRKRSLLFALRLLSTDLNNNMQLMYIPQGLDEAQIMSEYQWALAYFDPARYIIGFGLSYRRFARSEQDRLWNENARENLVLRVSGLPGFSQFRFHIFGARWEPTRTYAAMPEIIGIDSIKPCTCAYHHRWPLDLHERPEDIPRDLTDAVSDGAWRYYLALFCEGYGCLYRGNT